MLMSCVCSSVYCSIMAMVGNQPKSPLTHGWMREMWYIHNMHNRIFFSHKKNEILPFVAAWMSLEHIIPTEISQEQEDNTAYSPTYRS